MLQSRAAHGQVLLAWLKGLEKAVLEEMPCAASTRVTEQVNTPVVLLLSWLSELKSTEVIHP